MRLPLVKSRRPVYTFLMISALIMLGALAQYEPAYPGLIPYEFMRELPDGTRASIFVLVDQKELDAEYKAFIEVVYDEPWLPYGELEDSIRRATIVDRQPQRASTRERRLKEEWLANGGVLVDTAGGSQRWVFADEKQWADDARSRAARAYTVPAASATSDTDTVSGTATVQGPGFLSLWGAHIAIAAAAMALLGGAIALTWGRERWTGVERGRAR